MADADKGEGCFLQHETMAHQSMCSNKTVQRAIADGIKLNILTEAPPPAPPYKAKKAYRLNWQHDCFKPVRSTGLAGDGRPGDQPDPLATQRAAKPKMSTSQGTKCPPPSLLATQPTETQEGDLSSGVESGKSEAPPPAHNEGAHMTANVAVLTRIPLPNQLPTNPTSEEAMVIARAPALMEAYGLVQSRDLVTRRLVDAFHESDRPAAEFLTAMSWAIDRYHSDRGVTYRPAFDWWLLDRTYEDPKYRMPDAREPCPRCNGSGRWQVVECLRETEKPEEWPKCQRCQGLGAV